MKAILVMTILFGGWSGLAADTVLSSFSIWKSTSTWGQESLSVAISARKTWFAFVDPAKYNESTCPFPGDQAFAQLAIPIVGTNPIQYKDYEAGKPEEFLDAAGGILYPIRCTDGKSGLIELNLRHGVWNAGSFHPPDSGSPFFSAFDLRSQDQKILGLGKDPYFVISIVPITVGGKFFPGAIALARQTDASFDVELTAKSLEMAQDAHIWISADTLFLKLKKYEND